MAADTLAEVLRLVDEGRLTPEQAAPLLNALDDPADEEMRFEAGPGPGAGPGTGSGPEPGRAVRIQVIEAGRHVLNLRVPLALGRLGIGLVPGLGEQNIERIRAAIAAGVRGPILDVRDEDDDGVRIVIE